MKLYTESEVKKAFIAGMQFIAVDPLKYEQDANEYMDSITPIEIPSDDGISTSLCYYDLRNPDGISQFKEDKALYGLDDDDFQGLGNFSKNDCGCDNCFYGRHELANYILELKGGNNEQQ